MARQNVVHDNYYGISVSFYDVSGQALDNQVFNNSQAGIRVFDGGAIVQGNTVYSNGVGVQLSYGGNDQLSNNLIYANLNQGILVDAVTSYNGGRQITNNTIYQPVGDAVCIQDGSSDIALENNVLWVQAGYDLYVTADSEQGFSSDYNDLYTTATGKLASWQGQDFTDLANWVYEAGFDKHSLSADPQFFDPAGPDGDLGFSTLPDTTAAAQIVDNDSASGFSASGAWTLGSGSGYNNDYLQSTTASDVATYTFSVTPGWYQVGATWPATDFDNYSNYTIFDGSPSDGISIDTVQVDQARRRPITPPPGLPGKTWASFTSAALRSPCRSPAGIPGLPWSPTRCRSSACRGTTARTTTSTCRHLADHRRGRSGLPLLERAGAERRPRQPRL